MKTLRLCDSSRSMKFTTRQFLLRGNSCNTPASKIRIGRTFMRGDILKWEDGAENTQTREVKYVDDGFRLNGLALSSFTL